MWKIKPGGIIKHRFAQTFYKLGKRARHSWAVTEIPLTITPRLESRCCLSYLANFKFISKKHHFILLIETGSTIELELILAIALFRSVFKSLWRLDCPPRELALIGSALTLRVAGEFNSSTLSTCIDSTKFLTFLLGLGIAKAAFLALEAACLCCTVEAFKAASSTLAYAFSCCPHESVYILLSLPYHHPADHLR